MDTENIQQSQVSMNDQSADPSTQIGHYSVFGGTPNKEGQQTQCTQDSNRQKIMPDELSLLLKKPDDHKQFKVDKFDP